MSALGRKQTFGDTYFTPDTSGELIVLLVHQLDLSAQALIPLPHINRRPHAESVDLVLDRGRFLVRRAKWQFCCTRSCGLSAFGQEQTLGPSQNSLTGR